MEGAANVSKLHQKIKRVLLPRQTVAKKNPAARMTSVPIVQVKESSPQRSPTQKKIHDGPSFW